jgi:hypothetical protein
MRRAWEAMGPDLVTAAVLAERCGETVKWAFKKLATLEEHSMVRAVGSTTNGQQRVLLWRRVEGPSDGV